MHCFRTSLHQPLRLPQRKRVLRSERQSRPQIRHPAPDLPSLSWRSRHHPLRPQTWEHFAQEEEQVWNQNYRLWKLLSSGPKSVYIYSVLILQVSRSYLWHRLHCGYWHVVFWMCALRTVHRRSVIPGRKWAWTSLMHNGGQGHSA